VLGGRIVGAASLTISSAYSSPRAIRPRNDTHAVVSVAGYALGVKRST